MAPKKILVVDDDSDILEIVRKFLEPEGYEVFTAPDGPHAVEQANRHQPDLILLDNRMPFFSGVWYCDAFKRKANTKNVPVILISGFLDGETVRKAMKAGAVDFLRKPFGRKDLLEIVRKHLR